MSQVASSRAVGPNRAEFHRQFAASRRWHDVFQAVTTATVVAVFILVRTLESSICQAPTTDPVLQSFPCSGPLQKSIWVARRMPWIASYVSTTYGFTGWTVFLIADAVVGVIAFLQPAWYLRRGRTILLANLRTLIKICALAELALLPPNPVKLAWCEACFVGPRGLLILAWDCFLCPLPVRTHIPVATLTWAFAQAVNATVHYHRHGAPPPAPALLLQTATSAFFGLILPTCLLATLENASRAASLSQPRRTPGPSSSPTSSKPSTKSPPSDTNCDDNLPADGPSDGPSASCSTPFPDAIPAPTPAPAGPSSATRPNPMLDPLDPPKAPPTAPQPASEPPQQEATPSPIPTPAAPTTPAAAPPLAAPPAASTVVTVSRGAVSATAVPTPMRQGAARGQWRVPYQGCVTATVVSVKVHHHAADEKRYAIIGAVQDQLLASFGPCAPPTVSAFPGCLQIIATLNHPDAAPPCTPPDLAQLAQQLYDALPEELLSQNVSVQVGAQLMTLQPPAGPGGAPALVAAPVAVREAQLLLEPLCLVAGDAGAEVDVQVVGDGVLQTECKLVLTGTGNGDPVFSSVLLPAGTQLPTSRRLRLPAAVDAGPAAAHLVSTHPAQPGALLATAPTAALPPQAAAEIAAALATHPADPAYTAGLRALLRDIASAWHLPPPAPHSAPAAHPPLVADLLAYLHAAHMPALADALATRGCGCGCGAARPPAPRRPRQRPHSARARAG